MAKANQAQLSAQEAAAEEERIKAQTALRTHHTGVLSLVSPRLATPAASFTGNYNLYAPENSVAAEPKSDFASPADVTSNSYIDAERGVWGEDGYSAGTLANSPISATPQLSAELRKALAEDQAYSSHAATLDGHDTVADKAATASTHERDLEGQLAEARDQTKQTGNSADTLGKVKPALDIAQSFSQPTPPKGMGGGPGFSI